MKTLLKVPDLIEAIEPLVNTQITSDDIFRLIGNGDIKPLGYVQRIPIFELGQVAEIVKTVRTLNSLSNAR